MTKNFFLFVALSCIVALSSGCASTSQSMAPAPVEDRSVFSTQSIPVEYVEKTSIASAVGGVFGSLFAGISDIGAELKRGFNQATSSQE